ncbi:MAG TPA: hypothetical protein VIL09_12175 [Microvirga sp.]
MSRTAPQPDHRAAQNVRPEARFKPVALPALAAAVKAAQTQPRPVKHHDVPAILRKEALVG